MRTVIVGLGVQGRKRLSVAGANAVAIVDPSVAEADYRDIREVPIDSFDSAMLCVPDDEKAPILKYLLANGKHVLVEKPLFAKEGSELVSFEETARRNSCICYTAYNHRFEPHIVNLKAVLDRGILGDVYLIRVFYGNGTARDVRNSPWRDCGTGVLSDIGSHLLDMVLYLFEEPALDFEIWNIRCVENKAPDYVLFGSKNTRLAVQLEATFLSWKNTFTLDVLGSLGSAHISGLCKWGPSTLSVRRRTLPSGPPETREETLPKGDPTWDLEYRHFCALCKNGRTDLQNDLWINERLMKLQEIWNKQKA